MIRNFLKELRSRNLSLFLFGWLCFIGAVGCIIMIFVTDTQVLGINAWIKPLKFFISIQIFSWTMGWYGYYLPQKRTVTVFSWVVIAALAFEVIYISWQAGLGELSHFNISTPFYQMMFNLMGIAIMIMTLFTAYIGWLFFRQDFPDLQVSYLWGIRMGILIFFIFAFEGGIMAQLLTHTIGAPDGGPGLPLVNWSIRYGDLRVAHFIGMHALQALPLLGFFVLRSKGAIISASVLYLMVATTLLVRALLGLPLPGF